MTIAVKPNIDRFVYGAGNTVSLSPTAARRRSTSSSTAPANRIAFLLYRRVVSIERPGLYFIGFIQPLGPIMPLAEAQSEWVADLLQDAVLPLAEMQAEIAASEDRARGSSKRHTIEVDFHPYLRQLRRERRRSAQPA